MSKFIPRRFKNTETNEIVDFEHIIQDSNISIILGEPASGKTYQLKEYAKQTDTAYFVELINIEDEETIDKKISYVLLDSIDEALTDSGNPKKLQSKLSKFIKNTKETNPNIRFIITCRYLEWQKYFEEELKKIDDKLQIYEILPLSKDEINNLLKEEDREDFWNFIDSNYLEPLLKNIMIIFHLVENFREYEDNSSYTNIYEQIVKEYLTKVGEDREEENTDKDLNELMLIASSLATYMMLNRISAIDKNELNKIASECYKIDNKPIVADDLKAILNTALFKKEKNKFTFFHKSIQEYLTAYFINYKNLDAKTIKKIFAHNLRFYEEFEEVVVYLTNIKEDLFDEFVEFDPYIFKRHPSLTQKQQEKLLIAILNKYKVVFSQVRGRWRYFEGTTLVKFEKLDNLIELLDKYATLKEHGYYLMKLLEYNYSNELKEYMFELFKRNIDDKKTLKEIIRGNFIDNYEYCVSIYEFMKTYNLLEKNTNDYIMSFEAELFSSLYGIKYKHKYGFERKTIRTSYYFNDILSLLDIVQINNLKYIAPYLLKEDADKWLDYIKENYQRDKYNYKFIQWVIFAVLKNCDDKDCLVKSALFLKEKKIHLQITDKQEEQIDFNKIRDIFWEVYFEKDILQDYCSKKITKFYKISLDDIKEATEKYPITDYIEKYIYFRLLGDDIDKFLMQNEEFNTYMHNEWKKQEEQQKEWDRELKEILQQDKSYMLRDKEKKEFRKNYENSKKTLKTIDDLYTIFNYLIIDDSSLFEDLSALDKKLKSELNKKYDNFLRIIENEWNKVDCIKNKKSICNSKLIYKNLYMFLLYTKDLNIYIKSENDYKKLFWLYIKSNLSSVEKYNNEFLELTKKYFHIFIDLNIDLIKCHIENKQYEQIIHIPIIEILKYNIDNYNKNDLKKIIDYLLELDTKIYKNIKEMNIEYILQILTLDSNNYDFIKSLMKLSSNQDKEYLYALLKTNTNKALKEFFEKYNKINRYIKFTDTKPTCNKLKNYNFIDNKYDIPLINKEKIKQFKILMSAIHILTPRKAAQDIIQE